MKQKHGGTQKTPEANIDAALDVLVAIAAPGETFTQREIAAACGCSRTYIWQLERSALRKLRPILSARLQPAPRQQRRRCQGRLVRNEQSSSAFTETYVCVWCGATFDDMTGIGLGQSCRRSYLPVQGSGPGGLLDQVRVAEACVGGSTRSSAIGGADVVRRPSPVNALNLGEG